MREVSNVVIDEFESFNGAVMFAALITKLETAQKKADRLLRVNKHSLMKTISAMSPYEIVMAVERPFTRVIDNGNLSRDEKLQLMSVDASTDWFSFFDGMYSIPKIRKQEVDRVREVWEIVSPELKNIDFPEKRDPMLDLDFLENDN